MQFDIVTVFPQMLDSYFDESILKRGVKTKKIKIRTHDLRDFTHDKHRTTDDTPYGGGAGMLMKIEPIFECLQKILKKSKFDRKKILILLMSAKGKNFDAKKAKNWAKKFSQIIIVCGRYEGVDERVAKYLVDREISIGNFVLSGGELAAGVIIDAVSRFIPGVLGNPDSLREESHNSANLEYPQYTRPPIFKGWKVPRILLSGDHQKITQWRKNYNKK